MTSTRVTKRFRLALTEETLDYLKSQAEFYTVDRTGELRHLLLPYLHGKKPLPPLYVQKETIYQQGRYGPTNKIPIYEIWLRLKEGDAELLKATRGEYKTVGRFVRSVLKKELEGNSLPTD